MILNLLGYLGLSGRLWALIRKEINQILKNKQLLFLLLFPPTMQLLIYGFALNPDVNHLPLGVVDYAHSAASRELVAALTENQIFVPQTHPLSESELVNQVRTGTLTTGMVIPPDFNRQWAKGDPAEVQILIDAVDANTAGIAQGYITQILSRFRGIPLQEEPPFPVDPEIRFLYNPGLESSWFFVPGMIGVVLTLTGSLVSSVTVVREKDTGTLEQLLMTPAAAWEILIAKIVPLFVLLMGDILLALGIARLVFSVPFRGEFFVFFALSGLYVFVGIGVGIVLATISVNQQQAVLTSFFINLPLIQLSGAIAPVDSMPLFFRYLSLINPLRHYIAIVRGMLLKGVGLDVLWPHALALGAFAIVLLSLSARQFRKQLS